MLDSCWLSAVKLCTAAKYSVGFLSAPGFASVLEGIRNNNDLGHPVCENLRAGNWMAGYTAERLKLRQDTHEVRRELRKGTLHSQHASYAFKFHPPITHAHRCACIHTQREMSTGFLSFTLLPSLSLQLGVLLSEVFTPLSVIPHYLMPCLFEAIITKVLSLLLDEAHRKMGE